MGREGFLELSEKPADFALANMRSNFTKYLLLSFVLTIGFYPAAANAQTDSMTAATSSTPSQQWVSRAPFQVGEVLTYEAKFNRTLVPPLTVGDLVFSVVESPKGPGGFFLIRSEAQSRGFAKWFGKDIEEKLESRLDGDKFRILRSVKYDKQDERVRSSESIFDYKEGKVIYTETDPNDPARRPYQLASSVPEITYDVVSGIYAMRMMPLAVGKTFNVTVSDSGLVYTVPVSVTARERQKSIYGKVWTFRIEPQIFGDKRPFTQKGKLTIWIMDDPRRIPVRAEITASIGRIDVKLKRVELTPK
jgi:hypothetical protein